jgi:glycosyltransferase involved in cell wall biosynthesis
VVDLPDEPDQVNARRVLVVGHYTSERAGGEGAVPLRVFGRLRARGVEAWLLTHVSARAELTELLPTAELDRVIFAPGVRGFGPVHTRGKRLPTGLRTIAWGITQLERQLAMVPVARRLVRELAIDVVHQPISVSPVVPSPLIRLGAPVVMGPLSGGMDLPPGFAARDSVLYALIKAVRPALATAMNMVVRGRLEADVLLVDNDRTRSFLPRPVRETAIAFPPIGVVLDSWPMLDQPPITPSGTATRFLFVGRLVGWKAVDILLDSFALVNEKVPAQLEIVGDGPERARLEAQAGRLGLSQNVVFRGWLDPEDCARRMRSSDVFVSAALQEGGGIAVLEAMACGRPAIVSAWGGHLSTVDDTVGILVDVSSHAVLVRGLADAMIRLAGDPELRFRLGAGGRRRVAARYDWDVLVDRMLQIYSAVGASRTVSSQPPHVGSA